MRSVWRKRSSSRSTTPATKSRLRDELGVGVAHHVDGALDQRGQRRLLHAEQVGVAHGPADDAAQHVAAVLVGRERRRR